MPQIKPTVLIADDEEVIANSLAMILSKSGFEAHAVYSGEKALEMVQVLKPDILISDVVMSGITGIETGNQNTSDFAIFKILLFSGQAATANLLEKSACRPGHEFEILIKPVHPADLLARIRAAVPGRCDHLSLQNDGGNCKRCRLLP